MATIIKRMNKTGLSYRIQVKMRDKGSGKQNVFTTTWHPPTGLTEKQIEREVIKFADKYEEDLKMSLTASGNESIKPDTTLREYSTWWLERRKDEIAVTYYVNCKRAIDDFNAHIGAYKLKELNPSIIQRYYDGLDRREHTIVTILPKTDEIREQMEKKGKNFTYLSKTAKINTNSLSIMLRGEKVSMPIAQAVAKALETDVGKLFTVEKQKEKYAYETQSKIKRTLRTVLASAKKQRIISDNYASSEFISFPKRPKKEIDYMNDEEAKKFYAAADSCKDIRYKAATMILLLTGVRRGEICGLEWSNIDLEEGTISIERSVTTANGFGIIEKDPKTESSIRTIGISDKMISVLREYKDWYDQYKAGVGDRWTGTDRLFISEDGKRLNPGTILFWVHKICEEAGLPPRTVHSLRHTNITLQVAAGVPMVTVSGRAGHARTSTTTDIYSHFLKSSDKTAADTLESIFT